MLTARTHSEGGRLLQRGLEQFLQLGIPPSKLVLGLAWYGYDYPCISVATATNSPSRIRHFPCLTCVAVMSGCLACGSHERGSPFSLFGLCTVRDGDYARLVCSVCVCHCARPLSRRPLQ